MALTKVTYGLLSADTSAIDLNIDANTLYVDSSANRVGIGTTTPAKALQVKTDTNGDGINIQRNSTTADHYGQLSFSISTNDTYATPNVWIRGVRGSSYTNNFMTFGTGGNTGTEAMRIDSSQRVGIGTNSPGYALTISNAASPKISLAGGNNQNGIRFEAAGNDGVTSSLYYIGAGSDLMSNTDYGAILLDVTNNRSILFMDESNSRLNFNNNAMTITNSGNVGIGVSSPNSSLHVSTSGAPTFRLSRTGIGQVWLQTIDSSARLHIQEAASEGGTLNTRLKIDDTGEITFNEAYTFPTADGSASQFLQTDGSGNLSFATVSSSDNTKLPLAGGTMTGNLSSSAQIMTTQESANALKTRFLMGKDSGNTNDGALFINYATSHDVLIGAGGGSSDLIVSGGKIGIGTTSPGAKLDVESTGVAATPTVELVNTSSSTFNHTINAFAPNLTAGENNIFIIGRSGSTKNAGYIGYKYSSAGSNDNILTFGHWSSDNLMNLDGVGNLGIATQAPKAKLHIGPLSGGDTTAQERLRISGDYHASGSGSLIRFTNQHDGGTNPNSGEYNIAGIKAFDFRSDWGGALALQTAPNTSTGGNLTDRLVINPEGDIGIGISSPAQRLAVGTTTNYDPPGLGNSNSHFSILKRDSSASGNYGHITGVSSDGNVWQQVQRTDGTATAYHLYLQPSGGNVAIGLRQNYVYVPNPSASLVVAKHRSGTGNVSSYLTHIGIDAIGYAGSNYQLGCIDFNGGDTAGAHNGYGRIGCSTMVGTNNQETASLEFYVKAPGFSLDGNAHAMKITGKADTSSAGNGTTRNGTLFTYQGIAIDRSWANYPCLNIMNSTPYSSSASTQAELRIHGNNVSSASYPGTSGSDFSVTTRSDGGYATGSDRRRKKNITTIDNALSTVKQLTGKRFQTVNSMNEVQGHVSKNGYKFGFIAQEVEDIIPETVIYHEDEDDGTENYNSAYAMDYGSVVALLVNAIKEQDTTIQDLKSRIETLETK